MRVILYAERHVLDPDSLSPTAAAARGRDDLAKCEGGVWKEGGKWREEERHFKAEFGAAFFGGRTDRRTDGRGSASGREERSLLLLAVRYSSRSSVFSLSGVSSVRPPPQSSSVCQQFSTRPCDGERTEVSRNRSFHRTVIFARAGDA